MFDLTDFCRICTRAECTLINIFTFDTDNVKLSDKLTYCIAEAINEDDDFLPNLICESCSKDLQVSYSFKKVCLKTRTALNRCFSNENDKVTTKVTDTSQVIIKDEPISDEEEDEDNQPANQNEEFLELKLEDVFSDVMDSCKINKKENNDSESEYLKIEVDDTIWKNCSTCSRKFVANENSDKEDCDKCLSHDNNRCPECNKSFTSRKLLNEHSESHKNLSFVCSICDYRFTQNSHLQAHMRVHTGEKPYVCDFCNEGFAWNHHLLRHMKVHYKENIYGCNICNKQYSRIADLQDHMKTHRNKLRTNSAGDKTSENDENFAEIQQHACPKCGKLFNKHSNMLKHLWFHKRRLVRSHVGTISCEICKKQFKGRHKLSIHMRVHTGERPFSCTVCHKSFTQSGYLTYHMRIHTGERPFSCTVCGKSFTQKTTLGTHMRVHSNKTPLTCPICKKLVSYDSTLKRHMKLMHSWDIAE